MSRPRPLLLALMLLAGCGRAGEEEGTAPPVQADRPLLAREAVTLSERFRLSDPDRIGSPRDLAVAGDGHVYVLDFQPPRTHLLKYDSTGQFVLRFGTGDQQDRLVSAIEFSLAPWNTVLAIDRGQDAIVSFLTRGTFISAVEIEPGVALDVHALPEFGEFYLHKWVPAQGRSVVLHVRSPLDSLATTYEVQVRPGQPVRREARAVHYHTTVDRRGRLYVAFYDGFPVRVLTTTGSTVRTIDLAREPIPKAAGEVAAEREQNLARLREQAGDLDEELLREAAEPDSLLPLIEEIVVDPFDRLWVRTNRPDAAGSTPYDVFNERGEYLARVDVPGAVQRTAFRPDGLLFVIATSESGEAPEIVGYAVGIEAPGAPAALGGDRERDLPAGRAAADHVLHRDRQEILSRR